MQTYDVIHRLSRTHKPDWIRGTSKRSTPRCVPAIHALNVCYIHLAQYNYDIESEVSHFNSDTCMIGTNLHDLTPSHLINYYLI